jgi:hypothetical protein
VAVAFVCRSSVNKIVPARKDPVFGIKGPCCSFGGRSADADECAQRVSFARAVRSLLIFEKCSVGLKLRAKALSDALGAGLHQAAGTEFPVVDALMVLCR